MEVLFRKRSAEALLSSIRKEMKKLVKSKSVLVDEAKQAKTWTHTKRYCEVPVTRKFKHGNLVYNRNTKEDGGVRRVYETNGAIMYEVAVPKHGDAWAEGFYISDWAEDVLQISNNERLKYSKLEVIGY